MKNKIIIALSILVISLAAVGYVVTQPVNSLTMDVNPSIEIVTNRLDRVVEINPLNADAEELLKDFNPRDKNLEKTVNDLVDLLENKQIEATILNQAIARGNRDQKQTGVQLAAQRLEEIDGDLTAEQIGSMTVKELIHYSKENNLPIENLFKVAAGDIDGAIEGRAMISKEEAQKIALERVNDQIIKVELDDLRDDDGPEYEIKILSGEVKYELEIDAFTGEIREVEKDDDRDNDRDDDRDDDRHHDRYDDIDDDDGRADYKGGDDSRKASASKKQTKGSSKGRISADQAKAIALELTGGGTIIEFEADDEYEIEIKSKDKKYEIEIDAYTGKVLDFEVE